VATLDEAAREFGVDAVRAAPRLGEHTLALRAELR
jgi:hypothetical protein